jgi:dimethylhistidine N-methyltransferase
VSERQLENVAIELATRFPDLRVMPVTADFTARLRLPRQATGPEGHVAVFFGSTIGNLHPPEAAVLLRSMAQRAGPRGAILLGVDLRKDPGLLHLAYNDPEGVTAAFNRNVLVHLNRELGATFDPDGFSHSAYFNSTASRIEMHLVASRPQVVSIGERRFRFEAGDGIWTESSYKYTWVGIERLAGAAGLIVRRRWTDRQNRFALVLLQTAGA